MDPTKDDDALDSAAPRPRILINPPAFIISGVLTLLFVGFAAAMPDRADALFGAVRDWTMHSAGWFYVLAVAGFLVFVVALAVSSEV